MQNINEQEIFNVIKKLLVDNYTVPEENITMDSAFTDLEMDSLDTLDLINQLEKFYNIEIDNSEISKIKTISSAVECLLMVLEKQSI
jgi:acyl carrier protein